MSTVAGALADAVKVELDNGSWSQAFAAARKWLIKWSLADLATLQVTVVPVGSSWSPLDRHRDNYTIQVDVGVQKKINPNNNTEVDGLAGLLEEFADFFRLKTVEAGGKRFYCSKRELVAPNESLVAKEHLEDFRTFTGVLRLTFVQTSL